MKCPKCGELISDDVNFCPKCGSKLFKYKKIVKKSAKNIKASDFTNYFGTVFENYRITNWVYKSILLYFYSLKYYHPLAEKMFESKEKALEMQCATVGMGYHFRLTEELLIEEKIDYSKIRVKDIKEFNGKNDWITFYAQILAECDNENLKNKDLINLCHSLLLVDEHVLLEAENKLLDAILFPMFEDNLIGKQIVKKNKDNIARMVDYLFSFGYWLRFFENVYNFLNEQK